MGCPSSTAALYYNWDSPLLGRPTTRGPQQWQHSGSLSPLVAACSTGAPHHSWSLGRAVTKEVLYHEYGAFPALGRPTTTEAPCHNWDALAQTGAPCHCWLALTQMRHTVNTGRPTGFRAHTATGAPCPGWIALPCWDAQSSLVALPQLGTPTRLGPYHFGSVLSALGRPDITRSQHFRGTFPNGVHGSHHWGN